MKKKKILIFSVALVGVILLALATSYALFKLNITSGKNFKLKVGSLTLAMTDTVSENRIIIDGLIPTKDEDALAATGYNFTLTNTGNIDASYKIYLDDIFPSEETRSRLNNDLIRVNLSEYGTINNSNTIRLSDSNDRMILTGILKAGRSQQYTLRIWLDHSAGNSEQNKYFASQLRIEGQQFNEVSLRNKILDSYQVSTKTPDFTVQDTTNNTGKIFKSTDTNSGKPTYYFRGQVNNNYVKFANKMWRIVRINEDNTVRLILEDYITDGEETGKYQFNTTAIVQSGMYYSTSDVAKPTVDAWYQDNIASNYDEYVSSGEYFCDQARVTNTQTYQTESLSHDNLELALISEYTPDFRCSLDGNNKGPITGKVGLLTLDEVLYAGASRTIEESNASYYLYNGKAFWLSAPGGYNGTGYSEWRIKSGGIAKNYITVADEGFRTFRPVINLKDGVIVTGTGTQADPYTVQPKRNYADPQAILASFNKNSLKEAVTCTNSNGVYTDCAVYQTLEAAIASRDNSVIILTSDVTKTDTINIASTKNIVLDLNGNKIEKTTAGPLMLNSGNLTINDTVGTGKIINSVESDCGQGIATHYGGILELNSIDVETKGTCSPLYAGSTDNRTGRVIINGGNITAKDGSVINVYSATSNALVIKDAKLKSETNWCVYEKDETVTDNVTIENSTLISENSSVIVKKSNGTLNIKDSKIYAVNSGSSSPTFKYGIYVYGTGTVNITGNTIVEHKGTNTGDDAWGNVAINNGYNANGTLNITGEKATFDANGRYQSGIYIKSNNGRAIYTKGTANIDGAYIESTNNLGVEMTTSTKNLTVSNSTIKSYHNAVATATSGTVTLTNDILNYGPNGNANVYGYRTTVANVTANITGCTFTATGTGGRGLSITAAANITMRNTEITSEKTAINLAAGANGSQILSSGNTFTTTNDNSVYLNDVGTYDFYNTSITSSARTIYNNKASTVRIKGGQYTTTGTESASGIHNSVAGSITMCDATITSSGTYDINNAGAGTVTYNNVTFTNGTTTPTASKINQGTGSVTAVNTCSIPNE